MHKKVNSKNSEVKVPEDPVTKGAPAWFGGVESHVLDLRIRGGGEGLTRATDGKLDWLSFENESVTSEVPWKGRRASGPPQGSSSAD